jgi:hypothetical protein
LAQVPYKVIYYGDYFISTFMPGAKILVGSSRALKQCKLHPNSLIHSKVMIVYKNTINEYMFMGDAISRILHNKCTGK